jgi:hypothetical protein
MSAQPTAGQEADVDGDRLRPQRLARTEVPSGIHQATDVMRTEKPRGQSAHAGSKPVTNAIRMARPRKHRPECVHAD